MSSHSGTLVTLISFYSMFVSICDKFKCFFPFFRGFLYAIVLCQFFTIQDKFEEKRFAWFLNRSNRMPDPARWKYKLSGLKFVKFNRMSFSYEIMFNSKHKSSTKFTVFGSAHFQSLRKFISTGVISILIVFK